MITKLIRQQRRESGGEIYSKLKESLVSVNIKRQAFYLRTIFLIACIFANKRFVQFQKKKKTIPIWYVVVFFLILDERQMPRKV